MDKVFKSQAEKDYTDHDCLIVIIMSHGDKGIIYGTDGKGGKETERENFLETSEVIDLFSKSRSLHGKPKVFMLNTCQGSESSFCFDLQIYKL